MSDKDKRIDVEAPALPIVIHAQYLKDLSYESPNSPQIFRRGQKSPEMDMNFHLDAQKVEDDEIPNLYEVTMRLNITAKRDTGVAFIIECVYGALVSLHKDVPAEHIRPMLFVEVPSMLFPFARNVVAQATQNGGFPPLLLNPVDFRGMFVAHYAEAKN
jgi:preprotein translocase subunit SecB